MVKRLAFRAVGTDGHSGPDSLYVYDTGVVIVGLGLRTEYEWAPWLKDPYTAIGGQRGERAEV